ncbi:MAG TPA: CPBP family intramembrane metalloprotease [Verrucomicrobiales bacterium]|nr:CPBP family intramembrane metalloprotease [Verrucomicrobiales bacterium]HIL70795.1 CPBP family intramembrane metalloprotease [Verrucomicrobiota bacterium]
MALLAAYCVGLILFFGSQPLAGWQYAQMRGLGRWGVIPIALSAGFCEELIYRGYMMTALKRAGHPVWLAMVLSTLSFVLFLGILPLPFLVAGFIIGMIWAAIYQKFSILWITIYIHAFWDATVMLIPWGAGEP